MSYDYFALKISATYNLKGRIYAQTVSANQVSVGVWTLITATFALHAAGTGNYFITNIGDSVFSQKLPDSTPTFTYSASNKVLIGGPSSFKGSIYDFRIYSPGSSAVIDAGNFYTFALS